MQCVWISDEILSRSFTRFLRVSQTQRRHGSTVPGPLEACRRAAKRKHGAAATVAGGAPAGLDFLGLFGSRLEEAPRPDYEGRWNWEAPVSGPLPTKVPGRKDNGDWRPWMRPNADERVDLGSKGQESDIARFLEVHSDPLEASKAKFEQLLKARRPKASVDTDILEPLLGFLQSSANEPDAQLTLRLVQWLSRSNLTLGCSRAVAAAIAQKITLCTMCEEEESAVVVELLKREDAIELLPPMLDKIPLARLHDVAERTTKAVLSDAMTRLQLIEIWLSCLRASVFSVQSAHTLSELWSSVYSQLSQHFRVSELVEHFRLLEEKDLAMVLLTHWVPKLTANTSEANVFTSAFSLPKNVTWQSHPIGYMDKTTSSVFDHQPIPNNALVDLVATLAVHKVPYAAVLEEFFVYWQNTEDPASMVQIVRQMRVNEPKIDIPAPLATSLIQSFIDRSEIPSAVKVLRMVPTVPVRQYSELILQFIREYKAYGQKVWALVDRWAEQDVLPGAEEPKGQVLSSSDVVRFVPKMAYAWSECGRISNRVAYRRVFECYRFLLAARAPVSPLACRALVRAGAIQYIKARRPVPKSRLQFILEVIEHVEGGRVREQADRMIFDYWMDHRKGVMHKPSRQLFQEKLLGLQIQDDGSRVFRPWSPMVGKNTSPFWERQRGLFHAGQAVKQETVDGTESIFTDATVDENGTSKTIAELHQAVYSCEIRPPITCRKVWIGRSSASRIMARRRL